MSDPVRESGLYPMRLQRFLARAGVASRRGSERLMTSGRVRVNGVVVTELGSKVDPERDVVTVDGVDYEYTYIIVGVPHTVIFEEKRSRAFADYAPLGRAIETCKIFFRVGQTGRRGNPPAG